MGKETEKIMGNLGSAQSMTEFLRENKAAFINKPVGEYIDLEIEKRKLIKAKIIRDSGMNKRYFFDVLYGGKIPDRRYIIRIFMAMKLDLADVQWYLNACGYRQLYARDKQDCVIIYCINHKLPVQECNVMLNKIGLENLGFENT